MARDVACDALGDRLVTKLNEPAQARSPQVVGRSVGDGEPDTGAREGSREGFGVQMFGAFRAFLGWKHEDRSLSRVGAESTQHRDGGARERQRSQSGLRL